MHPIITLLNNSVITLVCDSILLKVTRANSSALKGIEMVPSFVICIS